jgi:hypothetical protein
LIHDFIPLEYILKMVSARAAEGRCPRWRDHRQFIFGVQTSNRVNLRIVAYNENAPARRMAGWGVA